MSMVDREQASKELSEKAGISPKNLACQESEHVLKPNSSYNSLVRDDFPAPPSAAAFHGLAGDIVYRIEPHTEADPTAILVQTLIAYGNAIGRAPFARV